MSDQTRLDLEAPWNGEFRELCTEEDVYYCFRLLLGRMPQEHEWPGHKGHIGRRLPDVVSMYLDSPEFKKRKLTAFDLSQISLESIHGFKMYLPTQDPQVGAPLHSAGTHEPHLTAFLQANLRPGDWFCDIGANIGYFSLLAAHRLGSRGRVLAFEPSPANLKFLYLNRQLNDFPHIEIYPYAVGARTGFSFFSYVGSNGIVSEASHDPREILESTMVYSVQLESFLRDVERLDFLKIDVEGGEHAALAEATGWLSKLQPVILSELSPQALRHHSQVEAREYLETLLLSPSYQLHAHDGEKFISCARDAAKVLTVYERVGGDHIDVVALDPASGVSILGAEMSSSQEAPSSRR